jgi:hypothetical protein
MVDSIDTYVYMHISIKIIDDMNTSINYTFELVVW